MLTYLTINHMIDAVFLINQQLDILVERRFSIESMHNILDFIFPILVSKEIMPIIEFEKYHIVIFKSGTVYFIGITTGDSSFYLIDILKQIIRSFELRYGAPVTENLILEELATAYKILDFGIDSGFPLFDESNAINVILPLDDITKCELNILYPWRSKGLKYESPDFLVTITEFVDAKVGKTGSVSFYQIRGVIQVLNHLSGMPEVTVKWENIPDFDDFAFHRCVQNQYFSDLMSFIPPDGFFDLMNYRVLNHPVNLPITLEGSVNTTDHKITVDYRLNFIKPTKNCKIYFTLPSGTYKQSLLVSYGKLRIKSDIVEWTIGNILSHDAKVIMSGGIFGNFDTTLIVQPILTVNFEMEELMTGFNISNIDIPVYDNGTNPFTETKMFTVNGSYELQTGGFL
ncbi:hypothetical protein TRFO_02620 [Tritrichomonas foetus]|uniref:MHD domain-containing protein n=1 Tax=Tritrichomonas foetus TaxID=1144522 RepID=A0A1J4L2B1_9EUKA|nr:hypothetical protein TRFO_02620 [Tritrichomonas foetus]|eukprot:OHT17554.1 hypothetical protein TRFO_02620 [Tritrichomonas foetus]